MSGMLSTRSELGSWSFVLGVIVAVVVGLLSAAGESVALVSLLIIVGFIVGLLNITARETNEFLIAAVTLVLVSSFGGSVLGEVAVIGTYLESVLKAILTYIIPAAIVVAVKTIYSLARD